MRVTICWSHLSGYMAACWRALSQVHGIELSVIAFATEGDNSGTESSFSSKLVSDLNVRLLAPVEQQDARLVRHLVDERRPEVVVMAGWAHRSYRALVLEPSDPIT